MSDPVSLSCLANKVFDKVFDPIFTYLVIYPITTLYLWKQNVKKLKLKVDVQLVNKRTDVKNKVDEAEQRGEEIFKEVKQWMNDVDEHISGKRKADIDELIAKSERKYCLGWCPNPKALYDLSEKAKEYAADVDALTQKVFERVSYFQFQKQESIVSRDDFVDFESRNKVLDEIMKALQSPTVDMIGVRGMLGMGKTTLVKEVKRKAEQEKLFDVVVMANVTSNPDLTKIVEEMARGLGMFQLPKELSARQVADRINGRLRKKNALVILDDVWGKIDLKDLGIPSGSKQKRPVAEQQNEESSLLEDEESSLLEDEGSSLREEQKECKVLLTSREHKVLSEKMGVKNENIFHVNKLEDVEAKELFKLRVEDDTESPHRSEAIEIVKRCCGLPLAIERIAKALRGKEDQHWNSLLQELKASRDGEYAVVRLAIEFHFSQLEREELKQTFLLCCLMGHNASIEDLMEYGTGLKLFPEFNKIEEFRDAALALVNNLRDSSLLLNGPTNMQFDMQDAVQDTAMSIASRDGEVISSKDEDAAAVWPDEEAISVKLKWIYLPNADISQLLRELELRSNSEGGYKQVQCPQLTFFHLSNKYPSSETAVPADFFEGMKNVEVLSLTKMHFLSMPQSISLLTKLRTLRLNQSKLGVLEGLGEIIGKLKKLQVLNLAGCDISELPMEIACLTMLKLLDMSDCTNLKVIPRDILSKLYRLEELKMANSFDQWQFIEQHENQNGNASLAELKVLQKLTTLEVCINDITMIPEGLFNAELKRYKIFVGDLWKYRDSSSENTKILKLELKADSSHTSARKLLKISEELHLEGLHGVKNVVYQLDNEGFQKLRYLYVRNAPEIQFMIDSERLVCSNAFPILEELVLQNLTKMEKIYRDMGATSFNKLRIITIECCHQLKNLFSFYVVKQLLQLQEISLKDCENIEEIVAEEPQVTVHEIDEAATTIELGQLRSLRFEKLPNFVSFCQEKNNPITNQGGSQLTSSRCMSLFNEKVVFPMLEELEFTEIKIDKIWNTLATPHCVQKLTKMSIMSCSDLKYLFSSSLAKGLEKLVHLEIKDCKSLREIITMETSREMGNCEVKFSSLKRLSIINCPKLMEFMIMVKSANTNEADNARCFFNEQVTFPSLESLILSHLKNLQVIWHSQLSPDSFCKLKELVVRVEKVFNVGEITNLKESGQTQLRNLRIYGLPSLKHVWNEDPEGILDFQSMESVIVWNCPSIKHVFPISVAKGLKQLQKLQIVSCGVEEIVAMERGGTEAVVKFVFPRLSNLKLVELRRLKYFYPGEHITLWPELTELDAFDCGHADEVDIRKRHGRPDFPIRQPFLNMEEIIPQLKRLSLSEDDIAMITDCRFKQDFFFKIKVLRIYYGGGSIIFPIGALGRFYNLGKLVLTSCSLKELFPSHGEVIEEQKNLETLSRIKTLELNSVVNLRHVWSRDLSSVLQNLEKLRVIGCNDLISLPTSMASVKNLTTLELRSCHKMENLVATATVQSLVHVKSMTVSRCIKLTEIVGSQGDTTQDPIIFSSLRYLKLECLTRLACFSSGNYIFDFPYMEQLIVEQCPKLEIFSKTVPKTPRLLQLQGGKLWNLEGDLNTSIQRMYTEQVGYVGLSALSLSEFPQLMQNWHTRNLELLELRWVQYLDICNCNSLRCLLTPSMVRSLVLLMNLNVQDCKTMEAVLVFPNLEILRLSSLNIQQIWRKQADCAQNLLRLRVVDCANLKYLFISSMFKTFGKLQWLEIRNCGMMEEVIVIEALAEEERMYKMVFPKLDHLLLQDLHKLTRFCFGSLVEFSCLRDLHVIKCPLMKTFISSSISGNMTASSEEVENTCTPPLFDAKVGFPSVEKIVIGSMESLNKIWQDQLDADSFCQLNYLCVNSCGKLLNIFPLTMLERLQKLDKLEIWNCNALEEIGFCCQMLDTEWPSLKKLEVYRCDQVQIFASEFSSFQRTNGDDQIGIGINCPIFSVNKATFPCLEELELDKNDIMKEIWHGQYPGDYFPKLKVLKLTQLPEQSVVHPFLLQSPNLEKLVVSKASFLELFQCQGLGDKEKPALAFTESSELRLSELLELVFYNLKTLEVLQCSNLKNLVPSFVSFKSLTTLEVSACHELINLIEYSTAKSMVQLTKMSISKCQMLKEIVACVGEEVKDGIAFIQLKYLLLRGLPRLASFCSGNCGFEFASLEEVIVKGCPNMQIFSQGECITTNKLQKVKLTVDEDEGFWEGNLNSTIKKMFTEKAGCYGLEDLKLSEFPELIEIWYQKPQENLPFRMFKFLEVCNCSNLTYLLTLSMALGLVQLDVLKVTNCAMMEQVITGEGAEETFPLLNSILLDSCSILTCFYEGSSRLKFSSLKQIIVANCPNLLTFASSFSREQGNEMIANDRGSEQRPEIPTQPFFSRIPLYRENNDSLYGELEQDMARPTGCRFFLPTKLPLCKFVWKAIEHFPVNHVGKASETIHAGDIELQFARRDSRVTRAWLPKLKGFYCQMVDTEWPSLEKLEVYGCDQVQIFASEFSSLQRANGDDQIRIGINCPIFSVNKATFPCLEELELNKNDVMKEIWHGQYPGDYFPKLEVLKLTKLHEQSVVHPFLFQSPNLEKLVVSEASFLELFHCQGLGDKEKPALAVTESSELRLSELLESVFYNLKTLEVLQCNNSKNLVPSFVSFKNLTTLEVSACHELINLIEYSTAKSMVQLTKMSISKCQMLKEIVACVDEEVKDGIVFIQLKYLLLCGLPRLASFCSGNCGFEFASLEEVIVMGCPNMRIFSQGECSTTNKLQKVKLTVNEDEGFWEGNLNSTIKMMFTEKAGCYGLEDLKLFEFPELIEIWYKKPQESLPFKRLKFLEVCNCSNLTYLLTPSMALGLVQLDALKVTNCAMMEQVIIGEGAEEMFPLLNAILLESCSSLTCFYEGSTRLKFSSLKQVTVANCPNLLTFASSFSREQRKVMTANDKGSEQRPEIPTQPFFSETVVLPNLEELLLRWMNVNIKWHTSITYLCLEKLKKLIIQGCDNLEYLFSSSIARGLVMLGQLEIRECKRMREIIVAENAKEKENLIFPQLNFLLLKDLQNIVGFYSGNCIVEFPSLKQLQVLNCPVLEGFIVKYFASTNIIADKQPFFNEQVAFPNLESLTLTHLKNLDIIWHNQFHADSFGKLKSLSVRNCEKLSTVFPFADMLGRIWKSLEKLIISQCGSLEVVFGIAEFNVKQTHAIIDTKLRELNIQRLPKLKYVWNKDPQGILTFHSLELVVIALCGRLKFLFPASIGKSLSQLQKLHLWACRVEEVVTMGEQGTEAIVNFKFPRLSSLKLQWLPRLQCFYPGQHTTTWPILKKFYFSHFNQVKRTNGNWQLDFPVRLPLFSIEKVIPQLEELSLSRHDIAVICERQFKEDLFFNVKVLKIHDHLDNESDVLPIRLLQRFCHLEELVVDFCNVEELFPSKGEVEEQEKHIEIETLSRIKTLHLIGLPYLRRIWSRDSSIVLQNLGTLLVYMCDSLISLSTSPASFQNLVTLNISNCGAMVNLVSISIVQSLVQLERMTVSECYMLTEIVGNEGNETQGLIMITFTKLRFLRLKCLPRLESFCSGNFTFKFPSLKKLIVIQCPKLMIFNEGDLSTPLLQRVELIEGEDKWCWESDLNTTIQRMYMEEVGFVGLRTLVLSNFPKLMETWHIKNPQELLDFRQLQVLEICDCSKFRYLLTDSMALGLVELVQLIVKNCGTMEQVIMGEGAKYKMEFPHLWMINLESCLDLTSFYMGSHSLELPSLYDFIVKDCPKMVTFVASTSSKGHNKEESQYLFSSKVETPNLEFLNLSSNNIQRILSNSTLEISSYVQNLRKLCVEGCGNLEYLLTSSMVKSFEQLNWLKICDCNMMEKVILVEEPMDEEKLCKIFFPNLEFLLLEDLPKLTGFCSGNYLELPCLWKLKISKCPVLKTFISSSFFGDMIASSENVKNTCALSLFDAKVAFPKLKHLVIEHVKSLNKIWKDQLEVDSFCQITSVSVVSCEKLLNIFPFSMLERFQRLDKLQIWSCDSLEEILESREPVVSRSQTQKATPPPLLETVTCLEDDVKDEIVFSKLKYLQLCDLPRLSSFCSVKCKFEFPFLEDVILMDCPSMQTFSMDEIRTPKLQKVKLTRDEDEGFWDGNLNSTIQLQFMQKSQGDSEN
ncbi:hypothetical protein SLEP1_g51947 [Rubroshorea leprosula]|uniref:AAA+ ATPase domain-containing protein n=1 Tax=Rubroshorea leprosula TaxID=152421 RepID=A0AAV5M6F2_9ROSI|nr:hypothetical protein SLEP1_g51947 [Rubroshorea leprosula]